MNNIPFAFIVVCTLIELTPGPNMAYLAMISAQHGRRAGLSMVAGIALGLSIVGLVTALGAGTVINSSNLMYETLRWAGIAYLLFLAWEGWQGTDKEKLQAPTVASGHLLFFQRGLITNLLNPKSFVFYVATLPTFIVDKSDAVIKGVLLTSIYVLIATAIHAGISLFSAKAGSFLSIRRREEYVRRALSLSLVIITVWLAITTAR